jgi:plastocyanin
MTRFRVLALAGLLALAAATYAAAMPGGNSMANHGGAKTVLLKDDCDPNDPAWNNIGGCALARGDVTLAEFAGENDSPLADAVVGHQAWRNDPSYLEIREGARVRVDNVGGRVHTFTEVEDFGGGIAPNPALNEGLTLAAECPDSVDVLPGGRTHLTGLTVGNHRFQCCFHPWMRALIKVKEHDS